MYQWRVTLKKGNMGKTCTVKADTESDAIAMAENKNPGYSAVNCKCLSRR